MEAKSDVHKTVASTNTLAPEWTAPSTLFRGEGGVFDATALEWLQPKGPSAVPFRQLYHLVRTRIKDTPRKRCDDLQVVLRGFVSRRRSVSKKLLFLDVIDIAEEGVLTCFEVIIKFPTLPIEEIQSISKAIGVTNFIQFSAHPELLDSGSIMLHLLHVQVLASLAQSPSGWPTSPLYLLPDCTQCSTQASQQQQQQQLQLQQQQQQQQQSQCENMGLQEVRTALTMLVHGVEVLSRDPIMYAKIVHHAYPDDDDNHTINDTGSGRNSSMSNAGAATKLSSSSDLTSSPTSSSASSSSSSSSNASSSAAVPICLTWVRTGKLCAMPIDDATLSTTSSSSRSSSSRSSSSRSSSSSSTSTSTSSTTTSTSLASSSSHCPFRHWFLSEEERVRVTLRQQRNVQAQEDDDDVKDPYRTAPIAPSSSSSSSSSFSSKSMPSSTGKRKTDTKLKECCKKGKCIHQGPCDTTLCGDDSDEHDDTNEGEESEEAEFNEPEAFNDGDDKVDVRDVKMTSTATVLVKHAKRDRAKVFVDWLVKTFGADVVFGISPSSSSSSSFSSSSSSPSQTTSSTVIMDVAGGRGDVAFELAQRGAKVYVVDPRPVKLTKAQRRLIKTKEQEQQRGNGGGDGGGDGDEKSDGSRARNGVGAWLPPPQYQTELHYADVEAYHAKLAPNPSFSTSTTSVASSTASLSSTSSSSSASLLQDRQPMLHELVTNSHLLIGMHPDQATEAIVDAALLLNLPFAVVPCCVFPLLFPDRRVRKKASVLPSASIPDGTAILAAGDATTIDCETVAAAVEAEGANMEPVVTYGQFIRYLLAKNQDICVEYLPLEGKNRVVYWKGKQIT